MFWGLLAVLDGSVCPQSAVSHCVCLVTPALPMWQVLTNWGRSGLTSVSGEKLLDGIAMQHSADCVPDFCFLPLLQGSPVTVVPFNKNTGCLDSLGGKNKHINSFSWLPLWKSKIAVKVNTEVRTDGLLALRVISSEATLWNHSL